MECSPVKIPRTIAAALAATALALSGVIAIAAPAAAHTPAASATCSDLTVKLVSYEGNGYNATNNVKVFIDDAQVADEWFGYSWSKSISLGNKAVAHSWKVVIDAAGYNYDKTLSGTSTPCTPPPPSSPKFDAAASVSVTEPTCERGAELVLGTATNATWGTPTATTGPGNYSVTATADSGHVFDDTLPTRTFEGALAGKLPADQAPCYVPPTTVEDASAAVTVSQATCTSPEKLVLGVATNAVWGEPTGATGPADYSVTATATTGHAFEGNKSDKLFEGTLADKLPADKAPCLVTPPVDPPVDPPMPPQPDPVKTVESIEVAHCDTDEIVTTTTTTTTVTEPNPDGSPTWVSTTPIVLVTQTTRVADSETCPDPDFTAGGGGGAGAGGTLATTGVDLGWAPWIAGLLALAGSGVLFYPRLRTALRR